MPEIVSPNKELETDELKKALEKLVDKLLESRPDMKSSYKNNPEKKGQLIKGLMKVLGKNGDKLTRGQLFEPEFLKKMALTLTVAMSVQHQDRLTETLKKIFEGKKIDLKDLMKLSPKELKKLMDEKFTKDELKNLHKELEKCFEDLMKDVKKFELEPSEENPKAAADDAYINLFGLISSAFSGGIAVPIPQYIGNALGFNDWNPNDGSAPIDSINSIKDTQFGDSLGLNASTIANYMSIDDTIVDTMQSVLQDNGLAPGIQRAKLGH